VFTQHIISELMDEILVELTFYEVNTRFYLNSDILVC